MAKPKYSGEISPECRSIYVTINGKHPWEYTQAKFIEIHQSVNTRWQRAKGELKNRIPSAFGTFPDPQDYQAYCQKGKSWNNPDREIGTYEQEKHRSEVKMALRQGLPVPDHIKNEYLDLV